METGETIQGVCTLKNHGAKYLSGSLRARIALLIIRKLRQKHEGLSINISKINKGRLSNRQA